MKERNRSAFLSARLCSLLPLYFFQLLLLPPPPPPFSPPALAFAMTQAPARVVRGNSAPVKACAARYVET